MAECFVRAFSGIFSDAVLDNPSPLQACETTFTFDSFMFDVFTIESILSKLKPSCCSGSDLLPPLLLRRCAPSLSYPVLLICCKCLPFKHVPVDWKDANVTPLLKSGIHSNPLNCRPINLTSVCCKSFDRVTVFHLSSYLESNHLLSPHQFGFRSGKSVSDQLLCIFNYVTDYYYRGVSVIIFFDYKKAFDVINHQLLIRILNSIGVRGELLEWLQDYLSSRTMKVIVQGSSSISVLGRSGVHTSGFCDWASSLFGQHQSRCF